MYYRNTSHDIQVYINKVFSPPTVNAFIYFSRTRNLTQSPNQQCVGEHDVRAHFVLC